MIRHASDWARYPDAIADTSTTNASFLHYAKTLKSLGCANHAWPLALMNPALQGVDPFSPDLTTEQVAAIAIESNYNYWYFLREVARVPQAGTPEPSKYLANRANMALNWCFLNNIDFANIMPRQCGKSVGADILNNWLMHVAGKKLSIQLLTRGDDLRVKNIKRLKEIRDLLPPYLSFYQPGKDANNTEKLTCNLLGNEYVTAVAQKDKGAADNVGRGLTCPIIQLDEAPYCVNVHISLPVALAGAGTARDIAEENQTFYGNLFTTTAGKKDTKEGKFMYELIHSGMYWSEILLDAGSREEAWEMIKVHAANPDRRLVNGTFSHRQIGKDDEWLRRKISESAADKDGAERDYLNMWTSGSESSPLSVTLNRVVAQAVREPTYCQKFKEKYVLDWYIPPHEIQKRLTSTELALCVDPSQSVGEDGNGILIVDLRNMEVVAGTNITTTSIPVLGRWIAKQLTSFHNMTLVLENAASGQALLDIVAEYLYQAGENPFRRIFNQVVDKPQQMSTAWLEVQQGSDMLDPALYEKYKKYFGFKTTGQSRPVLYNMVLQKAAQSTAHLINNKMLSEQIRGLVRKSNGRIDHPAGEHDDMVIAWLLAHWFSTFATNLSWYGIKPGTVQSLVNDMGAELSEEEIQERIYRERLIKRITELKERLMNCNDDLMAATMTQQIKVLAKELGDMEFETRVLADLKASTVEKVKGARSLSEAIERHGLAA
ncbi:DNA helicase or terminase large subunit [Vibrio phage vB_VmeM-Yong XC32]|nr:DNA helicase or terminase large subunit [Vibrio phage vB_VmeM-Yong XC31]QAX96419.1 DNA helicase or terminase large subunit [Vibrio phage vB_VmeM-Yong XC32]QAX96736.1 DNA helicase or terminase large subunit [Vibrio phage vB_VmeM-Yong MS31]QAX97055.1 DNA helicase or terminase large subunit [Vibrio phage vB_VmeM-Yong MS32]